MATTQTTLQESMDILIGWLTDSGQKASTLTIIETFLLQLSPFWASDLAFTFNLCTQFIEDMSHYVEVWLWWVYDGCVMVGGGGGVLIFRD